MQDNNLPTDWSRLHANYNGVNVPEEPHKKSFFFWFFITGLFIFLIALAYAGYEVYSRGNSLSADKIILNLNIDDSVKGGQTGTMGISVQNNNKIALSDAKLTIKTQKGFSKDGVIDQDIVTSELGMIVNGNFIATTSDYIFNGTEGDKRKVTVLLEYKIPGSNTIYKKETEREIKIITPSVVVNLDGYKESIEDHEYLLKLKIKNISYTSDIPLVLNIEVPNGFVIKRSSTTGETSFVLNDFKIGNEKDFEVFGYFKPSASISKTFNANVSTYEEGMAKSLISENIKEVFLIKSPVTFDYLMKVNSSESKYFENNLDNQMEINITNADADYILDMNVIISTADRVFTFNTENTPDLARVNPAEIRKLTLLLGRDLRAGNKDFEMEIYGKVRGEENSKLLRKTTIVTEVK